MIQNENEFLSKNYTNCLKGLFAIVVLIHHIRAQMICLNNTLIGMLITSLGYLSVGMFFFFSGYGLETQFKLKDNEYILKMPFSRIIPFYCICILSIFIYTFFNLILNNEITIKRFIASFFFGETIVQNGWYLQSIILIYLIYYIAYKLGINKKSRWVYLGTLLTFYIICCIFFNVSITYYESILAFPFGIYVAQYKDYIKNINIKMKYLIECFVAIIFFITFLFGNLNILPKGISIFLKMISVVFFICVILNITSVLPVENMFTRVLVKIFCEIYIIQGMIINLFHSNYIYIKDDGLYFFLTFLVTITISLLIHPVFIYVMNKSKEIALKKCKMYIK